MCPRKKKKKLDQACRLLAHRPTGGSLSPTPHELRFGGRGVRRQLVSMSALLQNDCQ